MDSPQSKYRRQLKEAWTDLHQFEAIQRNVAQRIESLRELIRATANMLAPADRYLELLLLDIFKRPTNIAEAVRVALYVARLKSERLTPVQIKEAAEERGFSFAEYTNPMASIHTILRRMKEANPPEIDFREDDGSYLLSNDAHPSINPALADQIGRGFWERVAKEQPIDQARLSAALDAISTEVLDNAFRKIDLPKPPGE